MQCVTQILQANGQIDRSSIIRAGDGTELLSYQLSEEDQNEISRCVDMAQSSADSDEAGSQRENFELLEFLVDQIHGEDIEPSALLSAFEEYLDLLQSLTNCKPTQEQFDDLKMMLEQVDFAYQRHMILAFTTFTSEQDFDFQKLEEKLLQVFQVFGILSLLKHSEKVIENVLSRVQHFLWPYYFTWMWIFNKILGKFPFLGDQQFQCLWMKVDGLTIEEHQTSISRISCLRDFADQQDKKDSSCLLSLADTETLMNFLKEYETDPQTLAEALSEARFCLKKQMFGKKKLSPYESACLRRICTYLEPISNKIFKENIDKVLRQLALLPGSEDLKRKQGFQDLESLMLIVLENIKDLAWFEEEIYEIKSLKGIDKNFKKYISKRKLKEDQQTADKVHRTISMARINPLSNTASINYLDEPNCLKIHELVTKYEQLRGTSLLTKAYNSMKETVLGFDWKASTFFKTLAIEEEDLTEEDLDTDTELELDIENAEVREDLIMLGLIRTAEKALISAKNLPKAGLRTVQLWTIIGSLICNEPVRIFEQQTGEGKTIIIAMIAALKAMQGTLVDVVSSSHDLAFVAVKEFTGFFRKLDLKVGAVGQDTDYTSQVLYGTLSDFTSDFLNEAVFQTVDRLQRPHSFMIIDEFDNVVVDRGLDVTMLSTKVPGMQSMAVLHAFIYSAVNSAVKSGSNLDQLHPELLRKLAGLNTLGKEVYPEMEHWEANEDEKDENGNNQVANMLPVHLKNFATSSMDEYLKNAIDCCLFYHTNSQYIIKQGIIPVDHQNTGEAHANSVYGKGLHQFLQMKEKLKLSSESLPSTFYSNIGFLRKYEQLIGLTGTLGSEADLKCIEKYLGASKPFDYAIIPKYCRDKVIDIPALVCDSNTSFNNNTILYESDDWLLTIYQQILRVTNSERPILIISQDIKTSQKIEKFLKATTRVITKLKLWGRCLASKKKSDNTSKSLVRLLQLTGYERGLMRDRRFIELLWQYVALWSSLKEYTLNIAREDDSSAAKWSENQKLSAGDIILTTNIGGRGTDYKLDSLALDNGGLFVLITFSPPNERVYRQARGRCGRSGQPGTAQIISRTPIVHHLARNNMDQESENIFKLSLKKDSLFEKEFLPKYQGIRETKQQVPFGNVTGANLRDQFAFLVDQEEQTFKRISKCADQFGSKADTFTNFPTPYDNPLYLVLAGNYLLKEESSRWFVSKKDCGEKARKLYEEALRKDDKLCGASTYFNLVHAYLEERGGSCSVQSGRSDLKNYFEEAAKCNNTQLEKIQVVHSMVVEGKTESQLAEQLMTLMGLYHYYKETCLQFSKVLDTYASDSTILIKIKDLPFDGKQAEAFDDMLKPDGFLPYFYELEEKKAWKMSWSAFTVTALGVLWFSLGCLCTMTGFVNLGSALITEGVNDLIRGAWCMWKGEEITLKDYLTSKLISIAVSAVTFGVCKFGKFIKQAWNGGVKNAWQQTGSLFSAGGSKIKGFFSGVKEVFKTATSGSSLKQGWTKFGWQIIKTSCVTLATNATTSACQYIVEGTFNQIYPFIQNKIQDRVHQQVGSTRSELRKLYLLKLQEDEVEKVWNRYMNSKTCQGGFMNNVWKFLDSFSSKLAGRIQKPLAGLVFLPLGLTK